MKLLFVYAHEDTSSFGSALHNRALSLFESKKHSVVVSDLYASGFHAVAAKWDFNASGGAHRNYMLEQKRVSSGENGSIFSEDIKEEIAKIREAELIIFEFPLWWSAPPAIIKGWFDKVFAMGVVWDENHRYDKGLLKGKSALVVSTAGDPLEYYSQSGIHGASIEQHLYPLLHSTLAHAGLDVLRPFFATNLSKANDDERQSKLLEFEQYLQNIETSPKYIYKHA